VDTPINEKITAEELELEIYDLMALKAGAVKPGSEKLLFLPYIRGERCPYDNPNVRGVFLGITPNHMKGHLTRAVLEGVVLNQRMILDALESQGATIDEMSVIGGGAKSALWRQIMADVYNKRILQPRLLQEGTSLGAAIAGGVGVGLFKDFLAAEKMVQIVDTQEPNSQTHTRYEKLYEIFKAAYKGLKPIFESLSQID
jgi:xylulokinase